MADAEARSGHKDRPRPRRRSKHPPRDPGLIHHPHPPTAAAPPQKRRRPTDERLHTAGPLAPVSEASRSRRAPQSRSHTDLALLQSPPSPLSTRFSLAGGRCCRHLRRRPTRNASRLAPATPPDPGALRARGKLLLPLSLCITSGPNLQKGRC